MERADAFVVFETMTEKQHEALALAANHLTSKQIAQRLGVAPVSVDKRIETVRGKLGGIPRTDLLRLYCDWRAPDDRIIGGSTILGDGENFDASSESRPLSRSFVFEDSLVLDARASWERAEGWRRPGYSPANLGIAGKLMFMVAGAVAIMMLAVLSMAFADALMSMVAS
jgi:DNA-binding CsgD family transcriptional regulator